MKILLLQPWISYRGAEAISVQQTYWLNKIGHKAELATVFLDAKKLPPHTKDIPILLPPTWFQYLSKRSRVFFFMFGWVGILYLLIKNARRFDVLNPHNLPTVWCSVLIGKLYKKKVIWTAHTVPEKVLWKNRKNVIDYLTWRVASSFLDLIFISHVDDIISVSLSVHEKIKFRYSKSSHIIENGVREFDVKRKIPKLLKRIRMQNDFVFLQVAALEKQKNQENVLDAFAKFKQKYKKSFLIFVGDGPDNDRLNATADRLKIADNVHFASFVSPEHLSSYYQICDVHLLPSTNDSFPATPLEALSFGKPSIITPSNGLEKTISQFVIVATDNSSGAIFNSMITFVKNEKMFKLRGQKGKKFIAKNFSMKNNGKKIVQVFEDNL